jgi:hypothetical protein
VGGLVLEADVATLRDSVFISNTAQQGGGLALYMRDRQAPVTLANVLVAHNRAGEAGSGIWVYSGAPLILHATIADNSGGDGSGITIAPDNRVMVSNTILAGHAVGISATGSSVVVLDRVLWDGGTPVTIARGPGAAVTAANAYVGDPAFVAPEKDDYHLRGGSDAIDRGLATWVARDLDGKPRSAAPDLGAYEWWPSIYLPLVTREAGGP